MFLSNLRMSSLTVICSVSNVPLLCNKPSTHFKDSLFAELYLEWAIESSWCFSAAADLCDNTTDFSRKTNQYWFKWALYLGRSDNNSPLAGVNRVAQTHKLALAWIDQSLLVWTTVLVSGIWMANHKNTFN